MNSALNSALNITLPRILAMSVILMTVPLVYLSFCWAMSDINAYPVRYAIERWRSEAEVVTTTALDKATAEIDTALGWSPDNASYHELKARVLLYRALLVKEQIQKSKDNPEALPALSSDYESNIRQALSLHESALLLRPHWPYSWANKSLMKAYLGEFDDGFVEALKRADEFGPWESSVNLSVLEAGLLGWRQLLPETRVIVVAAAERAAEHHFKAVRLLLDRYSLRYPVCVQMKRTAEQKKLCK